MADHLTDVVDETVNHETAVHTSRLNGQDESELGEKYRVDRRKLEQMLQENGDESGTTADSFFKQIMCDTETTISWPTKLKIGAKSKKDPHIKITGQPDNIKRAKDLVATKLESKANRVTLKMDVSHTDHSHIIGRRGQNINKVMDETNCHIHFPDSNRGSPSADKSNQVSITGQPEGVEKARARIRETLPLVLFFEILNYNNMGVSLDLVSQPVQSIAQKYSVTFSEKGRTQMGFLVAVRGSQDRVADIQEATSCLARHLTGSAQLPGMVRLYLDVAPQHHVFLVGRSGCNIREIINQTAAKIELSDTLSSSRPGLITVTGAIHSVIQARALLVNCLPLLLMFDLKEEEALHLQEQPDKVKHIEAKFGVSITIKPKPKQSSKSITIKSKESNAQNMYLTRLEILGNPMDPHIMQHPSPIGLRYPNGLPWYAHVQTSPSISPLASPTPHSGRSDSPVFPTRRITPPNPPPGLDHPRFDIWRHHQRSESFNDNEYRRRSPEVNRDTRSEGGSPKQSFEFPSSVRHAEVPQYKDGWKSSPNVSQTKTTASPPSTSPPTHVSNTNQRYTILEGIKNAGPHQLLDSHGSNAASSFNSLASASLNFDRLLDPPPQNKFADYEFKKGMSTELMKRKVAYPQVRVPTDQWSGLHLSKSEDFEALKKRNERAAKVENETKSAAHTASKSTKMRSDLPDRRVTRDPSASMQVSRLKNAYRSPFSQETSVNVSETPAESFDQLLTICGIGEFIETFKRLEINSIEIFMSLTKDDLKEAGFEPLGVRKRIEKAIDDLNSAQKNMVTPISKRSQNYRVSNPLEFNARSGQF